MQRSQQGMSRRERLRRQGYALLRNNVPMTGIASRLGVPKMTVWRWSERMKRSGPQSWRDVPNPGRAPRLNEHQRERLIEILERRPAAEGFSNETWTQGLVIAVIRKEFGARYSVSGVSTLLKSAHGDVFLPRMRSGR
jgi:transposase